MLAVLGWQFLTVQANYSGNWTGLFRTGQTMRVPERLLPATIRSRHPIGYDGQFYRFLAHDPFLREGTAGYFDDPLLRSRRILVPLLAWMAAFGHQEAIDLSYVLVIAGFIFLGIYCLGSLLRSRGFHSASGLLFLAVPATIVAVDSMTVDVALAALTACLAWRLSKVDERGICLALAAAGLVRETGLLLPAACVLVPLVHRDFRKALLRATTAVPALAWYTYLQSVLRPSVHSQVPQWVFPSLRPGVLLRLFDPPHYPLLAPNVERVVRCLDSLSLAAMVAAVFLAIRRIPGLRPRELAAALALFVALFLAMTDPGFWSGAYSYCRAFAPLFVILLAGSVPRRPRELIAKILVCALVDLRVSAEMETQIQGVFRWFGL